MKQKKRQKKRYKNKRIRRIKKICKLIFRIVFIIIVFICVRKIFHIFINFHTTDQKKPEQKRDLEEKESELDLSTLPIELQKLFKENKEARDFVIHYSEKEKYLGKEINLASDIKKGEVPLLFQWDKRWGYDLYGDDMIAIAGCGPTCMTMVYLYCTGDYKMNPRKMSKYAYENGYYSEEGTDWNFWTDGVNGLGLTGETIPLDEYRIKESIEEGKLVVCSMGPGDFTTQGHFILIRGYRDNGFLVNDPNSKDRSDKIWNYETLCPQIVNLWAIGKY
ncbi:C39 family peptidase [Lachnospiraceae bacterium LCP25S3_G4]